MSEYPAITRIRPISAPSVGAERRMRGASSATPAPREGGASATAALGSLILGLQITAGPPRRT